MLCPKSGACLSHVTSSMLQQSRTALRQAIAVAVALASLHINTTNMSPTDTAPFYLCPVCLRHFQRIAEISTRGHSKRECYCPATTSPGLCVRWCCTCHDQNMPHGVVVFDDFLPRRLLHTKRSWAKNACFRCKTAGALQQLDVPVLMCRWKNAGNRAMSVFDMSKHALARRLRHTQLHSS